MRKLPPSSILWHSQLLIALNKAGFAVAVSGDSINQGWTRVFELTYFLGYGSSIILYYTLNKMLPPTGLGIQENMPEDIGAVEGIAADLGSLSNENSDVEKGEKGGLEAKEQEASIWSH